MGVCLVVVVRFWLAILVDAWVSAMIVPQATRNTNPR